MLDIRSLSKKFGSGARAFHALKSIDITIEEGSFSRFSARPAAARQPCCG
ncbi:hypothetical protein ACFQFQ_27945 [Sulfitobacter porphyrae]|uniref:ABC transporter ATP-binding protein n=1 Tax=Sulfitobacter porphyrae TaxID=1246864 RepID=A0ABW2BAI1_9RHOB